MCVAIYGSRCEGWYWVSAHEYWQRVRGEIIQVSKKVINNGQGVAYLNCKVRIMTAEGQKTAYILVGAKKIVCENGVMVLEGARVGNLPKLRDCRLIGGYSKTLLGI